MITQLFSHLGMGDSTTVTITDGYDKDLGTVRIVRDLDRVMVIVLPESDGVSMISDIEGAMKAQSALVLWSTDDA